MGRARRAVLRLPKRSFIEKLTEKPSQCISEMMAVLGCFQANNYNDVQCASQIRVLNECVQSQVCSTSLILTRVCLIQ